MAALPPLDGGPGSSTATTAEGAAGTPRETATGAPNSPPAHGHSAGTPPATATPSPITTAHQAADDDAAVVGLGDLANEPPSAFWACTGKWPKSWTVCTTLGARHVLRAGMREALDKRDPKRRHPVVQILERPPGAAQTASAPVALTTVAEWGVGDHVPEVDGAACLRASGGMLLLLLYSLRPVVTLLVYRIRLRAFESGGGAGVDAADDAVDSDDDDDGEGAHDDADVACARLLSATIHPELAGTSHVAAEQDVVAFYSAASGEFAACRLDFVEPPPAPTPKSPPQAPPRRSPRRKGGDGRGSPSDEENEFTLRIKTPPTTSIPPLPPTSYRASVPWDAPNATVMVSGIAGTAGSIGPQWTDILLKYYRGQRSGVNHELVVFSKERGDVRVLHFNAIKRAERAAAAPAAAPFPNPKRVGCRMLALRLPPPPPVSVPAGRRRSSRPPPPKIVFYASAMTRGAASPSGGGYNVRELPKVTLPVRIEHDGRETWSYVGGWGDTGDVICHSRTTGTVMLFNTHVMESSSAATSPAASLRGAPPAPDGRDDAQDITRVTSIATTTATASPVMQPIQARDAGHAQQLEGSMGHAPSGNVNTTGGGGDVAITPGALPLVAKPSSRRSRLGGGGGGGAGAFAGSVGNANGGGDASTPSASASTLWKYAGGKAARRPTAREKIYAGGDVCMAAEPMPEPPPFIPPGQRSADDEYNHRVGRELEELYGTGHGDTSAVGAKYLSAVKSNLPMLVEQTRRQLERERVAAGMYKEERPLWRPILKSEECIPRPPMHTKGDDLEQYVRRRRRQLASRGPLSKEELAASVERMAGAAKHHDEYIEKERERLAENARTWGTPAKKHTQETQKEATRRLHDLHIQQRQQDEERRAHLAAMAGARSGSRSSRIAHNSTTPSTRGSTTASVRTEDIIDRLYTQGVRNHESAIARAEDRFRFTPAPPSAPPRDEQSASIARMYNGEVEKRSTNRAKLLDRYLA